MLAPANVDPDVINNRVCDWIPNYTVLLLTGVACISRDSHAYADEHHEKRHKYSGDVSWFSLKCSNIFIHLQRGWTTNTVLSYGSLSPTVQWIHLGIIIIMDPINLENVVPDPMIISSELFVFISSSLHV